MPFIRSPKSRRSYSLDSDDTIPVIPVVVVVDVGEDAEEKGGDEKREGEEFRFGGSGSGRGRHCECQEGRGKREEGEEEGDCRERGGLGLTIMRSVLIGGRLMSLLSWVYRWDWMGWDGMG